MPAIFAIVSHEQAFAASLIMKTFVALLATILVANGEGKELPAIPPEMDASKYVTDGDSRQIWGYYGEATHSCSYPNDPTTADDVKQDAKNAAKDTQYTHVSCDTCGGWSYFDQLA